MVLIISVWFTFSINEIHEKETYPDYTDNVEPFLESCSIEEFPIKRSALKWYTICLSHELFGNERIIPLFESLILLMLTFIFASQVTKNHYAGTLAVFVLATSGIFLKFDTTSTYDQTWSVLLLASFIMALRSHWSSSVLFFLSIIAKPYSFIFLPMIIWFILRTKKRKIPMIASYLFPSVFILFLFITVSSPIFSMGNPININQDEFIEGLYSWFFYFDSDWIILTLPFIIILLAKKIKSKIQYSDAILFSILLCIFSVSLIHGLTDQLHHAYRFSMLIIFLGTGLGLVLTNTPIKKFNFIFHKERTKE